MNLKKLETYSRGVKAAKGVFGLHFQVVEMDWRLRPEGTPQRSEKWRDFPWI
ncbi:hypothetical protein FXW07_03855 [Methanosarcina sp. DH1]|uniref:hypothetical protein n=1 Tax=Methanosarcina sp. DH1 TaxID=2605695 RepID=UPI001E5DDD8C|nr:hypothetical protein [Methanosarcina sp. DH1]MCC4765783.1 hypothetical protein [Methanosarcina sp. DH1]